MWLGRISVYQKWYRERQESRKDSYRRDRPSMRVYFLEYPRDRRRQDHYQAGQVPQVCHDTSGEGPFRYTDDADPHKDNKPYLYTTAKEREADFTVRVVNTFILKVLDLLKNEKAANGILLRGFSEKPNIPLFPVRYRLKALA